MNGDELFDDGDSALLARLGDAVLHVDPIPAGLTDRVVFALAFDELLTEANTVVETATLAEVELSGARGEQRTGRLRSLEVTARGLTAMLTIGPDAEDGGHRLDGWLAADRIPGHTWTAVLRIGGRRRQDANVDADGRFVLTAVPDGLVQLVFASDGPNAVTVVTPAFEV
jgi:hypothetical protein